MANVKEIKSHIKTIKDTQKVTKAMYLISSVKYRAIKDTFLKFIPYIEELEKIIGELSPYLDPEICPYTSGKIGRNACLVITADKGLAGDYNKNVLKCAQEYIDKNPDSMVYVIGNAGMKNFARNNISVEKCFDFSLSDTSEKTSGKVSDYFKELFLKGEISGLTVIYTSTHDGIRSKADHKKIFPLSIENGTGKPCNEFEYFPDEKTVLNNIIPLYLDSVFYSILIQSSFSEQSARMMAMDSANTNAGDMLSELNIQYNHLRQNAITQEIAEISGERKTQ